MNESVIIDAVRSPIGIKNGNMVGIRPDDLTAQVVKELLKRNKNANPNEIDDFVLGCAFPEGPQGMLMAKGVAILAGIPETCAGAVVNRFCGSSMDALHQISAKIESGDIQFGIAAGVEDMFSVPMGGLILIFIQTSQNRNTILVWAKQQRYWLRRETYHVSSRKNFQLSHTKRL